VKSPIGSSLSSSITLTASGTGGITSSTPQIIANTLTLTSGSNIAANATATSPLTFKTADLTFTAPTNSGKVNLSDTSTQTVTLEASAAGTATLKATSKIAAGGLISVGTLTLTNSGGGIGDSAKHLQLNSTTVTASSTGAVLMDNTNTAASTLGKSKGQSIQYTSAGRLTINGITTTAGAINVQNTSGALQTAVSAVITATNGSITLQDNDSTVTGVVTIAKSTKIATTGTGALFPVSISVGTGGTLSATNPSPQTIKVTGTSGQAQFSTQGIVAIAPVNTINLKGSDVTLNAGSVGSIKLNGGVSITADPVVAASATSVIGTNAQRVPVVVVEPVSTQAGGSVTRAGGESAAPTIQVEVASVEMPSNNVQGIQATSTSGFALQPSINSTGSSSSLAQTAVLNAVSQGTSILSFASPTHNTTELKSRPGDISAILFPQENAPPGSTRRPFTPSERSELGSPVQGLAGGSPADSSRTTDYDLTHGNMVFTPGKDMVIKTPLAQIKVAAGSAILVMAFNEGVSIYNLHDRHSHAVVVSTGAHDLPLAPGNQVLITNRKSKQFDELNPAESIAYRMISEYSLGPSLKAFTSDFSIAGALSVIPSLKQLHHSNRASDEKLFSALLKNAAVLDQLHANRGVFQ
jgi:hypothetical protein